MKAYIRDIAYALPDEILTNDELSILYPDWTSEKIYQKTGILSRHITSPDECASDLAIKAAKILFAQSDLKPEHVDFVLLATQSPDYILPTTACIMQDKLGIPTTAGAFDFNLGCSAYIYGLAVAKGLISAGIASNILLLTAETYSKYINKMDKSTRTLFGDAASATWVCGKGNYEIGEFDLGTDGSGYDKLIIPAGAAKLRKSPATEQESTDENGYVRSMNNLYMNGSDIFSFTIDAVPKSIATVLSKNSLTQDKIDLFIFHQANQFMLEYLRKKLKIPMEKFVIDFSDIGNTVSSTIPIAMKRAVDLKRLDHIKHILLIGFGVGLSWGSVVLYNKRGID